MSNIFLERQEKIFKQLSSSGIFAAVLKDFEGSRNSSIRYLTGHPQDAILFIFSNTDVALGAATRMSQHSAGSKGTTLLVPWDINLAKKSAYCSDMIPYTDFNRNFLNAVVSVFAERAKKAGEPSPSSASNKEKIEFSASSSLLEIKSLKKLLPDKKIICRNNGIDSIINKNRMIKDENEITIYREAAKITDKIINELEKYLKGSLQNSSGQITETEIALLIEKLIRENGAEGTGFETLVAGHERSWAIHPYPSFSSSPVANNGTTIIDFGVKHKGYKTDVTITLVGKNPADKLKEMINLVSEAAGRTEKLLKHGVSVQSVSENIKVFLKQYGYSMPHSLGHGIGLDVHENPILRFNNETSPPQRLKQGMVIAVEPGLYDPLHGGVRLENDYLITKAGCEKLTNARIIFFDN